MKILRYILFPIVPIYYLVTWLRNTCYDLGWKSSKSYELPIICVGNLSVGGTGKTPMIEYLIRFLEKDYSIATLSRGYKRQTDGFVIADEKATALTIGDEPFQFYKKFKNITVSVDADRQHGISKLIDLKHPDIILLDDAFQHRKVKAGFNILLTAYHNLYANDIVLPTGNLREPRSGAQRADVIVVTKCPKHLSEVEKQIITKQLKPLPNQNVFFSAISYSDTIIGTEMTRYLKDLKEVPFTLVTGIADPEPLVQYLKHQGLNFEHLKFKDHYNFTDADIETLKRKERLITTEKDYMRLQPFFKDQDHLFYLPIAFEIDDHAGFFNCINSYLKTALN